LLSCQRFAPRARLIHRPVWTQHRAGLEGGALFGMCLEYLGGGSLQQLMDGAPEGRIRQFEVARMAFHILPALQHIHQLGVIHRDLKPANIMITQDDEQGAHLFKLIDFGISVLSSAAAAHGQAAATLLQTNTSGLCKFLGTRHWMSPEQCTGQRITAATDLWSLGAVMFAALSGRQPFAHGVADEFAVAQAIVNDVAPRLDSAIEVRITHTN
jgi:serine/threonine protein kinase